MKLGFRKTNYNRRTKNLLWKQFMGITPSTAKRRVKKKANPIYGAKLSGDLKPKQQVKNKVYNKYSMSIWDWRKKWQII